MILLAEDEPSLRSLIEWILETAGYPVVSASGVAEALAIAAREGDAITLLLTDLVMDDGSGCELAERLRAVRPALPVVFCSGYSVDPGLDRGTLAETSSFVRKPFTQATLLEAVTRELHRFEPM